MMRVGIAISSYNKIDDVKFNIMLVRSMWKKHDDCEFDVYVCHNNAGMRDEYSLLEGARSVVECDDLEFDASRSAKNKHMIRRRQVNCWQTGVYVALSDGCDFAIHYHADAFILDPAWLVSHTRYMHENAIEISGRGFGLSYTGGKLPEGDIDDHFFIVKKGVDESFFRLPESDTMKVYSSEGYLANRIRMALSSLDAYHHYDDFSCNEYSDKSRFSRDLNPYNYDPKRFLLHTPDPEIRSGYVKRVYNASDEVCRQ